MAPSSFKVYSVQLIPALTELRDFLRQGFEHVVAAHAEGRPVSADDTARFLAGHTPLGNWNPTVMGAPVLDDKTRKAGIRFVAGVSYNLAMRGKVPHRITP